MRPGFDRDPVSCFHGSTGIPIHLNIVLPPRFIENRESAPSKRKNLPRDKKAAPRVTKIPRIFRSAKRDPIKCIAGSRSAREFLSSSSLLFVLAFNSRPKPSAGYHACPRAVSVQRSNSSKSTGTRGKIANSSIGKIEHMLDFSGTLDAERISFFIA